MGQSQVLCQKKIKSRDPFEKFWKGIQFLVQQTHPYRGNRHLPVSIKTLRRNLEKEQQQDIFITHKSFMNWTIYSFPLFLHCKYFSVLTLPEGKKQIVQLSITYRSNLAPWAGWCFWHRVNKVKGLLIVEYIVPDFL